MYEVNLRLNANRIRVVSIGDVREVQYNGRTIDRYSTCAFAALGSFVFEVEEDGQAVVYTVVFVGGSTPTCFVGRNGELIYCDAPGHEIDRTDSSSRSGAAAVRAPRCRPVARPGWPARARRAAPRRRG
jgi:hypothetical protein